MAGWGGGRGGGGEMEREVRSAVDALRDFAREVEGATAATEKKTKVDEEKGGGLFGGLMAAGAGLGGAVGLGAAHAIDAVATTGDFDAGIASVTRGLIKGLRGTTLGEGIAQITGLGRVDEVLGGAAARVSAVTGDLARYGYEVSDESRSTMVDTAVEQQQRFERERSRVYAEAYSPQRALEQGVGLRAQEFSQLLEAVREIGRALHGAGGQ